MSDPKEITGVLWFADHEPKIFGHLQIGTAHYEIAGIRRSDFKTDLTGRRVKRKIPIAQLDMFDETKNGGSGTDS